MICDRSIEGGQDSHFESISEKDQFDAKLWCWLLVKLGVDTGRLQLHAYQVASESSVAT